MKALDKPITRPPWEPASRRDYALSALRCARLRAQLAQVEIQTAAMALRGNLVSPELALSMLSEVGREYLLATNDTTPTLAPEHVASTEGT
jgi:hypothetical protein